MALADQLLEKLNERVSNRDFDQMQVVFISARNNWQDGDFESAVEDLQAVSKKLGLLIKDMQVETKRK